MILEKKCVLCGKIFEWDKKRSKEKWLKNAKYCSFKCSRDKRSDWRNAIARGHIGKKRPNMSLEKHPSWKGGKISRRGYVAIKMPGYSSADAMGYVLEHRFIMEQRLCRFLTREEVVHHINGDKKDNRAENLMLFPNNREHVKIHNRWIANN